MGRVIILLGFDVVVCYVVFNYCFGYYVKDLTINSITISKATRL